MVVFVAFVTSPPSFYLTLLFFFLFLALPKASFKHIHLYTIILLFFFNNINIRHCWSIPRHFPGSHSHTAHNIAIYIQLYVNYNVTRKKTEHKRINEPFHSVHLSKTFLSHFFISKESFSAANSSVVWSWEYENENEGKLCKIVRIFSIHYYIFALNGNISRERSILAEILLCPIMAYTIFYVVLMLLERKQ